MTSSISLAWQDASIGTVWKEGPGVGLVYDRNRRCSRARWLMGLRPALRDGHRRRGRTARGSAMGIAEMAGGWPGEDGHRAVTMARRRGRWASAPAARVAAGGMGSDQAAALVPSAARMRSRVSRSTARRFFRAASRNAALASRSISRSTPPVLSCRRARRVAGEDLVGDAGLLRAEGDVGGGVLDGQRADGEAVVQPGVEGAIGAARRAGPAVRAGR